MLQGSLVQILSEYAAEPTSGILNFGIGRGIKSDKLAGKIGLVLGVSSLSGLYDVYDILLADGSIASIEDLRLKKIEVDGNKENKGALQSR